jgi:hypothetical protein
MTGKFATMKDSDPLTLARKPERVNYATGVLLDAQDFRDEQTYHRARLARVLRYALGMGTLAGLRVVVHTPIGKEKEVEIRVEPGAAIDRLGRLVEVGTASCIRLDRWFAGQEPEKLNNALVGGAVIVDLFLSAHVCERAKTPAFAAGPFDALDAVVSARLEDSFELKLVLRVEDALPPPLPKNFWPTQTPKRLEAVLGSWFEGVQEMEGLQEHVDGQDFSAVFLARISIPAAPGVPANDRPTWLDGKPITADNNDRPFIFLPGKWLGEPFKAPAMPAKK